MQLFWCPELLLSIWRSLHNLYLFRILCYCYLRKQTLETFLPPRPNLMFPQDRIAVFEASLHSVHSVFSVMTICGHVRNYIHGIIQGNEGTNPTPVSWRS